MHRTQLYPLLVFVCASALLLAACGTTTFTKPEDGTTASDICETPTHCSLTITNIAISHHDLQWTISTIPQGATVTPRSGMLQPGKVANVTITSTTSLCKSSISIINDFLSDAPGQVRPSPLQLPCN